MQAAQRQKSSMVVIEIEGEEILDIVSQTCNKLGLDYSTCKCLDIHHIHIHRDDLGKLKEALTNKVELE